MAGQQDLQRKVRQIELSNNPWTHHKSHRIPLRACVCVSGVCVCGCYTLRSNIGRNFQQLQVNAQMKCTRSCLQVLKGVGAAAPMANARVT